MAICEQIIGNQSAATSIVEKCIEKYPAYTNGYLMKA